MARVGADSPTDAGMQYLDDKREAVQRKVDDALRYLELEDKTSDASEVVCFFFLHGNSNDGTHELWGNSDATDDDWNHVLSQGLGARFEVAWYVPKYSLGDMRVLRLGEPVYNAMKLYDLHPDWNGSQCGGMSITVVDDEGAKLAVAMALHTRLGANSLLALVSSQALTLLLECNAVPRRGAAALPFSYLEIAVKPFRWQMDPGLVRRIADLAVDYSEECNQVAA